jgi:hypothetical protein
MTTTAARRSLAALSLLALPAAAHHSPAQFDLGSDATIEGTITAFSWRNPHVYFDLDVIDRDGRHTTQRVEAGPVSNMVTLGFDSESIRVGEHVVVQVKPNKNGAGHTALGWLLTKTDGTMIPLHVRATPATAPGAAEAPSLAGTWVPQAPGFAGLAAAARTWPLTDAGRAAVEATQEARDASRSTCVPFGPPALMALPSTVIVELGDTEVTFRFDVMGAVRVVHLDQSSHPTGIEPSLQGHSIGHWEGDTLVVDTAGYAAHPDGYAFDRPSSAAKHVVERLTLTADRKHVDYEAVVEDPEYLAAPIVHRSQWDYRPEQKPSNVPCDAESAGRFVEDY